MPRLSQLGRPIPLDILLPDGDTLHFGYALPKISLLQIFRVHDLITPLEEAFDDAGRKALLARELQPLLTGWDLTEDDDTTAVPITEDSLMACGDTTLVDLWGAIEEDALPKLVKSGRSSSPSATAPASDSPSPTGGEST